MLEKKGISANSILKFLINNAIPLLLVLISVVVGIMRPTFLSVNNLRNLIANTSIRFIIALGVSGSIMTKGVDLSAGRSVGFSGCLAATFLQKTTYGAKVYPNIGNIPVMIVLLGVMGVASIFGLVNGVTVSFLNVPPLIATLGMMTVIYGICLVFTGAQPIGGLRDEYTAIATGSLFNTKWVSYLGLISAAVGVFIWFVYNKMPHGKHIYAIGGNEQAAEVSGISLHKTKLLIYITAGALYGLAGFLLGARAGGMSVNVGFGYELEAIAGCVIGGVSTNGGIGRVSGILIGVLVFELLKIALQFMGVQPSYTFIVQGLVIVFAVALDMRKTIAKK
ncbi:MAG: beta-methylgalactoside transporter [Clostridiales bacterium]|nr:beta-methylgalactoside transporter [Clostridiales bacterium]